MKYLFFIGPIKKDIKLAQALESSHKTNVGCYIGSEVQTEAKAKLCYEQWWQPKKEKDRQCLLCKRAITDAFEVTTEIEQFKKLS